MTSLLIGNSGSFFIDAIRALKNEEVSINTIELTREKSIKAIEDEMGKLLSENKIQQIIFIGGEVRNKDRMFYSNFLIPKCILDVAIKNELHFVYLSSMAVFEGYLLDGNFDNPKTTYGYTKRLFDIYSKDNYGNLFRIYPASIVTTNRLGSIQKYLDLLKKIYFAKFISFPGKITYIKRESLLKELAKIAKNFSVGEAVLMNEIELEKIRHKIYSNKSLKIQPPYFFIKITCRYLPELAGKITALFYKNYIPCIEVINGDTFSLDEIKEHYAKK